MKRVRSLREIVLTLVVLGGVIKASVALEQIPIDQQRTLPSVVTATPTITAIEDNKIIEDVSSKTPRN